MGALRSAGICWLVISLSPVVDAAAPQSQRKPSSNEHEPAFAILQKHCFQCHGADQQQGGLRLDERSHLLRGGKHGSVVKTPSSILLQRVASSDISEQMPPKGNRLKQEEIEILQEWIAAGSPWPSQAKPHWAFQPIRRVSLPGVKNAAWVIKPFDAYVLHRLEQKNLKPSDPASSHTLIRRLYLDLVGTLPTPEAVESYISNPSDSAYEQLVDRLLASHQFGERWARHWLDLARYGDSDGLEHDEPRPHAHLYREWVIDAYNRDMPFDQFTIDQLAGDLLPNPGKDQLLATGFHRQTLRHNTAEMVNEDHRIKMIKDRVNTTGLTWLGMTVACAECHSHKFDPLSQREYYQLFAFFNDADEVDLDDKRLPAFRAKERITQVQLRGNPQTLGATVVPGTPAFLPPLKTQNLRATRLDLAHWLMQPDHPLTARVEANRVWQHLFGFPLTGNPDDLGQHGSLPAYPELLDWLATELQQNGWSRKKLIRTIVTSAVYRQSSRHRDDLAVIDPANTLLARQNRFRLEAEIVHDISLQVAGLLQIGHTGGPSFQPKFPNGLDTKVIKNNKLIEPSEWIERHRRGIYIHVQRTYQHPLLMALDAPDGNLSCACRNRQMSPAQALTLLNDPLFSEAAHSLGERLDKHPGSVEEKLKWGMLTCLGRAPEAKELAILGQLLDRQKISFAERPWKGVAAVLLNMEAFTTRE